MSGRRAGLVLHLTGPLQAWGASASYAGLRPSWGQPSRSALIGLCAAALGRPRGADITDLVTDLVFGVRVDDPGQRLEDFHTVGGGREREHTPVTSSGSRRESGKGVLVTRREYLAGAGFTVGLDGPRALVDTLEPALRWPVFPLFLGRRSCPPSLPLLVTRTADAGLFVRQAPVLGPVRSRVRLLADPGSSLVGADAWTDQLPDQPTTFDGRRRSYRHRVVRLEDLEVPADRFVPAGLDGYDALRRFTPTDQEAA